MLVPTATKATDSFGKENGMGYGSPREEATEALGELHNWVDTMIDSWTSPNMDRVSKFKACLKQVRRACDLTESVLKDDMWRNLK